MQSILRALTIQIHPRLCCNVMMDRNVRRVISLVIIQRVKYNVSTFHLWPAKQKIALASLTSTHLPPANPGLVSIALGDPTAPEETKFVVSQLHLPSSFGRTYSVPTRSGRHSAYEDERVRVEKTEKPKR